MISQELKDQIEKEATEYSRRIRQESGIYTFKDCYTTAATKYAEQLEEKDKEIEEIRASRARHVIEKFELQAKYNNLIDQLESKDHETEELKIDLNSYRGEQENSNNRQRELIKELESRDRELAELKELLNYYKEKAEKGEGILKSATDIHFIPGKEGDNLLVVKDRELAQLKEIAERMINYLKDIERCGECHYCSENAGCAIITYAEWCKQIK